MAESKLRPWTDAEKVGFLFQIIEKGGAIPWDELTLPEGRTKKAVQVMIDKEKQKIKKARAQETGGEGSGAEADGKSPMKTPAKKPKATKRKAADDAGATPKKAKGKAGKTQVTAGEDDESDGGEHIKNEDELDFD